MRVVLSFFYNIAFFLNDQILILEMMVGGDKMMQML